MRRGRPHDEDGDPASAWRHTLQARDDRLPTGLAAAAADLVDTVWTRHRPAAALERFGREAGAGGWDLATVVGWIDALGTVAPRGVVDAPDATAALVRGWAAGATHGSAERRGVDPDTGLVTADVLSSRLAQLYDRCQALGVSPHRSHAIGIVDLRRPTGLRGHAVAALVGSVVASTFRAGELCVALRHRVAVLAPFTPALGRRLSEVADAARADPVLAASGVVTWIEPLPIDTGSLATYLADLDR